MSRSDLYLTTGDNTNPFASDGFDPIDERPGRNPAYDAQFNSFSPIRTFSAIASAETRVDLFVAGTATPARSTGFGVVFSDVDEHGSASIKLLGVNGNSLGVYHAPPCPGGFSFVGVQFPTPLVTALDIRSGHGPLGADAADVGVQHGQRGDHPWHDDRRGGYSD